MTRAMLSDIFERLFEEYGPQHWWPGQTAFEIVVGAILTQNTNWSNVEKAIENLRKHDLLCCEKLTALPQEQLAELIRPAGYFNIKAKRLKNFLHWLDDCYGQDLGALERLSTGSLREQLLDINGIGPETADSICLYAFGKPIFVVDAYTARVFGRHGLLEPGSDYEQIQQLFMSHLESDVALFNEFHALIVQVGKNHCKPKPRCSGCPLESLPHQIETELF